MRGRRRRRASRCEKIFSPTRVFPYTHSTLKGEIRNFRKKLFFSSGNTCVHVRWLQLWSSAEKGIFSLSSPSHHRLRRLSYLSLIFSHNRYSNELPPPAFGKNEEFSRKNPSLRLMQWMENEKNIFSFFLLLLLRRHFPPFFLKIRGSRYMPKWVSASCLFLLQEKERD